VHSDQVDQWLGLRIEDTECLIRPPASETRSELWTRLPARSFLTPYTELRSILEKVHPNAGQTIIDLGAGYGRMAFVLARHFPGVHFIGYEIAQERVAEATRALHALHPSAHAQLLSVDLSTPTFAPAAAPFYFLFDYGTEAAVSKTLEDLKKIASRQTICVIARGRLSRHLIDCRHPWLSQVVPPWHAAHISIYRSANDS